MLAAYPVNSTRSSAAKKRRLEEVRCVTTMYPMSGHRHTKVSICLSHLERVIPAYEYTAVTPQMHSRAGIDCVKWRQSSSCEANGVRDRNGDLPCDSSIAADKAGYCECSGRELVKRVKCGHKPFTCKQACDAGKSRRASHGNRHITRLCVCSCVHALVPGS